MTNVHPYQKQIPSLSVPVLEMKHVSIEVKQGKSHRLLVEGVNLTVQEGETLALVGESGSGKSVTATSILGQLPPSLRMGKGEIWFLGENLSMRTAKQRRLLCGAKIGCVFQDYQGSFTPFLRLGSQLVETIQTHQSLSKKAARELALEWLQLVGLPAERVYDSYPFQLSGGQRQRAALACAMMLRPKLLIADEVTTALDVLTGEAVLDVMENLQRETGCAVLMISHDLRHVLKRADKIAVMKEGRVVETNTASNIQRHARHPYTQLLLNARPRLADIHGNDGKDEGFYA